ncbi:dimethylsulfonioproprionate lyase family protein [Cypionkella sp.]|uniref:dimethylsulfonioproprionate lyase family protein n=1 Tax=Cypionkella sp. TaxID=2811411 RepID=UPI002605344A|nr:dimethylsulfonioproprionate lyase family protein [Cypionkella sp.]MDB5665404.1 transcriptional regulator [Cypionkella sp.]
MRNSVLSDFLDAAEDGLRVTTGKAAEVAAEVVKRWQVPQSAGPAEAERLPVCEWVAPALAANPRALAQSFAKLERGLRWSRRASADPADAQFWHGHANAMILGPGGLEDRRDVWLGVTVMAPGTLYTDHSHPPAEVYLPLSAGEWWNAEMAWTDPGAQGFIYNPPGILHAMRAGAAPFLALWFLPT